MVEQLSGGSRMALEHQVMVPRDNKFVAMGLFAQPLIEIDDLFRSPKVMKSPA
ncbi:MAG TPA: hypothetical protein VGR47_10285 [Terracidiphilus sp.]|nr:hypothetical protein [Terracidiphilus sp.]